MKKLLTQGFSSFLRGRRAKGHFERRPMLETLTARPAAAPADLLAAALEEPAQALLRLASQAGGLDEAEAALRLARDGPNEVQHEAPLPGWLRLWRCYLNPFNLLLTALALLSFASADSKATVVIGVMVALSTGTRFVQEGRAHRAAEGLRALVTNTATVLRRGGAAAGPACANAKPRDVAVRELVAGDVVNLSAGDMIPADCRVLSARDLFVAQAAMTGESLPVEKFVQAVPPGAAAPEGAGALELRNLVFMGTNVVSGTATALVVATGGRSTWGMLAAHASASETAPNAFQAGVNSVSWLLIRFAAVMVPIVFFVNGATKGDWLQAFSVRAVGGRGVDARDAADDCHQHPGQGRVAAVAQAGGGEAAGRDTKLRRDGRAVYRQDRHADARQGGPGPPRRRLGRRLERGAELGLPKQPLPDRP